MIYTLANRLTHRSQFVRLCSVQYRRALHLLGNEMMEDSQRLELITEAVLYCQRVRARGMPVAAYTKALREPVHFLWERRAGSKIRCAQFRSKAATGLRPGNRELIFDHAVPFSYLQKELLSLDPVTPETVSKVLHKFGTIVLITKEENAELDRVGYGRKMPDNWDGQDPLARYKAVGIDVLENGVAGDARFSIEPIAAADQLSLVVRRKSEASIETNV